jgi:hypothetical protein
MRGIVASLAKDLFNMLQVEQNNKLCVERRPPFECTASLLRAGGGLGASGGGAATRPALPLLWRPHVRHRDLRCRLPTTLPADGNQDRYLMSENRNIPHPNHQRPSSLVIDQIRRCSAQHLSGIAFRTACIRETHRQRYPIKADQPNLRAQ